MSHRGNSSRGWTRYGADKLAALARALQGQEPKLSRQQAAQALARSREGTRLLARIIESAESPQVREAAIYGFAWGTLRSPQFCLLLRVFEDSAEHPAVRGQAAEALGPRLHDVSRRGRQHQRFLRAVEAFKRGLDDPAPEVRLWSIFALAHPENAWLLPKLGMMVEDLAMVPGMWTVRQEALWAIRWIKDGDIDCDPRSL